MTNASVLIKNKDDKFLNVFWQYSGNPRLENNITKAFINTIDSLKIKNKRKVLRELFGVNLASNNRYDFKYYLQKDPPEALIKAVQDSKRFLFAFSPTGISWGYEGIDKADKEEIKKAISSHYHNSKDYFYKSKEEIETIINKETKDVFDNIKNRGGSRPDGWIFIYENDTPSFCIAMENKLFDLDPFQLNNHCKKSLFLKENKIIYKKYSQILECFDLIRDEFLVDEFMRYMYFLQYWEITTFEQLYGIDDEYLKQYVLLPCKRLLEHVTGGAVDYRPRQKDKNALPILRYNVKDETLSKYIKEINMSFDLSKRELEVGIYFGASQKRSKILYQFLHNENKKGKKYTIPEHCVPSFHFQQVGTGKNIEDGYLKINDSSKYISFWIEHCSLLKQSNETDRKNLIDKMRSNNLISESEYKKGILFSNSYPKKCNVCAEFGVTLTWSLSKVQKLEKEGALEEEIKQGVGKVCHAFNISIPQNKL